ncbi:MAG: metallophosphoesterase [Euryarchaeota archaeon]|nr:metallophosphoesterase [Euryarchaeota archaeon]
MKLGIISDSHDNLGAIEKAVEVFNSESVDMVIHAGDFIAPFTSRIFRKLKCDLIGIFGNNDGEKFGLRNAFKGIGEIHEDPHSFEIGGKKIIVTHHPNIVDALARCYDIVIYGHTHKVDMRDKMINPGECGGWLTEKRTVAILLLEEMRAEIVELR